MIDPGIQPKVEGDITTAEGRKKIQAAWKKWWADNHYRLTRNPLTGQYYIGR